MIQAKFGLADIAIRTLEVYTTATLEAALSPETGAEAGMARVHGRGRRSGAGARIARSSTKSRASFRTSDTATPEPELAQISIGSRPARRSPVAASRACARFHGSSPGRRRD